MKDRVTKVIEFVHPYVEFHAMHGMTMLMMYEVTEDKKYLNRARLDYHRAESLQECGFVQSFDCYLAA